MAYTFEIIFLKLIKGIVKSIWLDFHKTYATIFTKLVFITKIKLTECKGAYFCSSNNSNSTFVNL